MSSTKWRRCGCAARRDTALVWTKEDMHSFRDRVAARLIARGQSVESRAPTGPHFAQLGERVRVAAVAGRALTMTTLEVHMIYALLQQTRKAGRMGPEANKSRRRHPS